jgi:hypothetical protein
MIPPMRAPLTFVAAGILVFLTSVLVSAHHSWTVEYDGAKKVSVKGVVTKMEWTNPHTRIYVDSTDEKGTVTSWNFEMASTVALERGGWSRRTLQPGTAVTIDGFEGRKVRTRAIASAIKTAEGKDLFVGSPGQ